MAHLPLVPIGKPLAQCLDAASANRHRQAVAEREARVAEARAAIEQGGGSDYAARVQRKGKLTARLRVEGLRDADAPCLELGTFVNWAETFAGGATSHAAGVVTVLTQVQGRWCVVIANDNTVASGAWWPRTPEKIQRAQQVALRLHLPVLYLVDCSGLFLPEQARSFPGARGAGHIFKMNSLLSRAGVPQLAGVCGDCIAGGGYMPIISDRVIMTEGAYMVIAGAALLKGAKGQHVTSLDIGGPEVHVHASGCADLRVPDDASLLATLRAEVARLPSSAAPYYRAGIDALPPRFAADELSALLPADHRQPYDAEQVLARLCDQSLAWELLPHLGREVLCAVARFGGLPAAVVLNRQGLLPAAGGSSRPGGILYREGIAKLSAFTRACDDDGLPMLWLQDIAGFDIGAEAEAQGLLGYGSSLIHAHSTHQSPVFTVLLRKASGAGYYAMAGLPYDPALQLSTALTRLSVMEGRTLAIASHRTKLDDDFQIISQIPAERAATEKSMRDVEARIEADMDPLAAASRMDTDEVISLTSLRPWLVHLTEMAYQATGHRRSKNPRIWALHDLAVVGGRD